LGTGQSNVFLSTTTGSYTERDGFPESHMLGTVALSTEWAPGGWAVREGLSCPAGQRFIHHEYRPCLQAFNRSKM